MNEKGAAMKRHKAKQKELLKLDLNAVKHGLTEFPWPYKDETVEEMSCVHLFNRIPGKLRGAFMNEAWRVLIPDGKMTLTVPHWSSMRATADFSYEWPPVSEMSFCFFNRKQREDAKVHLDLECNFDIASYGCSEDQDVAAKEQSVKDHWKKHFLNTVFDLQMNLIKRP